MSDADAAGPTDPTDPTDPANPADLANPAEPTDQIPSGAETPGGSVPDHDPSGLGLARDIARSLGAQTRRRRRTGSRPPRVEPQLSGPRPDDRDPQLLSSAVERLVEAKGWATDINVRTLLGRWALLVGTVTADHSKPEEYAAGVITVRADSTAWATQLRLIAPQLVARLNDQLGDGTVTRLKILGPDAPSWKRGRLSVRDGRGPRDTYG